MIKLVKKWQRLATLKRKRISTSKAAEERPCSSSYSRAEKGHFVVYSANEKHFMIPLAHLKSNIFVQLLDMGMVELGVQGDGPIMLPWDSDFVEYALSLIQRCTGEDLQKTFLVSMAKSHCLSSSRLLEDHTRYQSFILSF